MHRFLLSISALLNALAWAAQSPGSMYLDTSTSVQFGSTIAYVPPSWNNVIAAEDFNRNVSVPMWMTRMTQPDTACMDGMHGIRHENISFIVYDSSFYTLLGVKDHTAPKALETIFNFPPVASQFVRQVHDATVYSPSANAIFFAELHVPAPGYSADAIPWVWRISLNGTGSNGTGVPTTEKVYPSPPMTMPNGAYELNGAVYWAQEGNYTTPGGIVRMDPHTLATQVVLNNFYGHRFNALNDIVITKSGVVFFTDGYYGLAGTFNDSQDPMLTNNIYRWDMVSGSIRVAAGAGDAAWYNPNGAALSPDEKTIYFGNRGNGSDDANGARTIFSYDLTSDGYITNQEIFAYMDSGIVDGIKTDSLGNVYAGVTGGVDVFNSKGILLGKIKCGAGQGDIVVNMAWAGNWFYMVGRTSIYRVQLTTTGPD